MSDRINARLSQPMAEFVPNESRWGAQPTPAAQLIPMPVLAGQFDDLQ
jgi:hypothetical protein